MCQYLGKSEQYIRYAQWSGSEIDSQTLYVDLNLFLGKPTIFDAFTITDWLAALVFLNVGNHNGNRCLEGVAAPLVNKVVLGFRRIHESMAMG